jgi:segregation and condensation protein A
VDAQGNEIDPRQELVEKILEYRRFKETSMKMAEMEALRQLMVKRGNIQQELSTIGEDASEGTEIQQITLFKLMKAFEKVIKRQQDRLHKPQHVVFKYNYTMEQSRDFMIDFARQERSLSFERIFFVCDNRIHAIFLFLTMLELVQQRYLNILIGEGMNNFIVEWNDELTENVPFGRPILPADPILN